MAKKEDWFHDILSFLYLRPLDGTYYDFKEIVNEADYGIRFDNEVDFDRLANVIVHLKDMGYINLNYEKTEAYKNEKCITHLNEDIRYHPNHIKGTFKTWIVSGTLTIAGHTYMLQRERDQRQHDSTVTTNLFIKVSVGAMIASALLQGWAIWETKTATKSQLEQQERIHLEDKEAPPPVVKIYLNDSTQTTVGGNKK